MKAEHWLNVIVEFVGNVGFLSTIPEDLDFATSEEFLAYVEAHPDELVVVKNLDSSGKKQ